MSKFILANISFLVTASVSVIVWLVRLESKTQQLEKDFNEQKEVLDFRDVKYEARFEKHLQSLEERTALLQEIKERMIKIESDISYLKAHYRK